jgi:hypothetical protein
VVLFGECAKKAQREPIGKEANRPSNLASPAKSWSTRFGVVPGRTLERKVSHRENRLAERTWAFLASISRLRGGADVRMD